MTFENDGLSERLKIEMVRPRWMRRVGRTTPHGETLPRDNCPGRGSASELTSHVWNESGAKQRQQRGKRPLRLSAREQGARSQSPYARRWAHGMASGPDTGRPDGTVLPEPLLRPGYSGHFHGQAYQRGRPSFPAARRASVFTADLRQKTRESSPTIAGSC